MNHCVRLLLLFTPSLVALGLLGIAFATNWWTIALERNIPKESSLNKSNNQRIHSKLISIPLFRGLLSECIEYRNIKVLVGDFDYRTGLSREDNQTLANEICSNNQFPCHTGVAIGRPLTRCIDHFQKCNHIVDCEDKSDERSCPEQFFQCRENSSKCPDGKSCYRPNEICDGISNCVDDSDEKNCNEEKCRQNQRIYCPREGKCSQRENSKRCDGIVDCEDSSDEENCHECHRESLLISCDLKCLPYEYRCDGIIHCSDLRDESNCPNYTKTANREVKILQTDRQCLKQPFNPFRFSPPKVESLILDSYPNPTKRLEYLNFIFYLQLIVFYGILGGLIFLLFAVISLFFSGCCRRHCISVPFYFYGFWMLLAWLVILTALVAFVFIWLWQKQTVLDPEKSLLTDIDIHDKNPTLRHMEFFGLSFWLACGAALATFIGLLLSYSVCCTIGSSRADDKEYEIMQMQNY